VYTSRHVYFDELVFPFQQAPPSSSTEAPAAPAPTVAPAAAPARAPAPGLPYAPPAASPPPAAAAPLDGAVTRA
jgi:hypothetical protein